MTLVYAMDIKDKLYLKSIVAMDKTFKKDVHKFSISKIGITKTSEVHERQISMQ